MDSLEDSPGKLGLGLYHLFPPNLTSLWPHQNDIKLGKEKVRRKHAIVLRQEEELQSREQALGSALRELQGLTAAVEVARGERATLNGENAELKAKLEESKSQLQSNEQMIRWLNQQVSRMILSSRGFPDVGSSMRSCFYRSGSEASSHVP